MSAAATTTAAAAPKVGLPAFILGMIAIAIIVYMGVKLALVIVSAIQGIQENQSKREEEPTQHSVQCECGEWHGTD